MKHIVLALTLSVCLGGEIAMAAESDLPLLSLTESMQGIELLSHSELSEVLPRYTPSERRQLKHDLLTLLVFERLLDLPSDAGRLKAWQQLAALEPDPTDASWSVLLKAPDFENTLAGLYYRNWAGDSSAENKALLQVDSMEGLLSFVFGGQLYPDLPSLSELMERNSLLIKRVSVSVSRHPEESHPPLADVFHTAWQAHSLGLSPPVFTALPPDLQPGLRLLGLRQLDNLSVADRRFLEALASTAGPLQAQARLIQLELKQVSLDELADLETLIARQNPLRQPALQRQLANLIWRQREAVVARKKYLALLPGSSFAEKMNLLQIARRLQDPAWQPALKAWRADPDPVVRSQALQLLLDQSEMPQTAHILPQPDWHPFEKQMFLRQVSAEQLQAYSELIQVALADDDVVTIQSGLRAMNTLLAAGYSLESFWPAYLRLAQSPDPKKVEAFLSNSGLFQADPVHQAQMEHVLEALFESPDPAIRQHRLADYFWRIMRTVHVPLAYEPLPPKQEFEPLPPKRLQALLADPELQIRQQAALLVLASRKTRSLADYQQALPEHQLPPFGHNLLRDLLREDLTLELLPLEPTLQWLTGFPPKIRNWLQENLYETDTVQPALQAQIKAQFATLNPWEQIRWLQSFRKPRHSEDVRFLFDLMQTSSNVQVQSQALRQLLQAPQELRPAEPSAAALALSWLQTHGQHLPMDQVSEVLRQAFEQAAHPLRAELLTYSQQNQPAEIQAQLLAGLNHSEDLSAFESQIQQAFDSQEPVLVFEAARLLQQNAAPIHTDKIRALLASPHPALQAIGLALVEARQETQLIPLLEPLLEIDTPVVALNFSDKYPSRDRREPLKVQALEVLIRILPSEPGTLPTSLRQRVSNLLTDPLPPVRHFALQTLGDSLPKAELLPLLQDPDLDLRLTAARFVFEVQGHHPAEMVPATFWLPFLAQEFFRGTEQVLTQLARYPEAEQTEVLQALKRQLPGYAEHVRRDVELFLLRRTGFASHATALQTLRQPALYSGGSFDWEDLPTHLDLPSLFRDLLEIAQEPDLACREQIIKLLLESSFLNAENLEPVLKVLSQPNLHFNRRLDWLNPTRLSEVFESQRHLPLLAEMLQTQTPQQKLVLNLLERLKLQPEQFAVLQPGLWQLMTHSDSELAEAAISSLMRSGTRQIKQELFQQAIHTQDAALRQQILKATHDAALRPDVLAYLSRRSRFDAVERKLLWRYQLSELLPQLLKPLPLPEEPETEYNLLKTLLMLNHASEALPLLQKLSAQAPDNLRYL